MSSLSVFPIDYDFDFSKTNLSTGNVAKVGDDAAYRCRFAMQNKLVPYEVPNEGFLEVMGAECYPGIDAMGDREHFEFKILVGGQSHQDQVFNDMVAPGLTPGMPDPLSLAGLRHGVMAKNIGLPMLLGGHPNEAAIKVPPNRSLEVEVTCPTAARGGATLTQPTIIRLWVVQCLGGSDALKSKLKYISDATGLGYYDGNQINAGFQLGDLDKYPMQEFKNPIPESGTFNPMSHWGKLPGGMEQDRPRIHVVSVYAKQMYATTSNEWYQFVVQGGRVQNKESELYWAFDKKDALKITHIGVKPPAVGTIERIALRRSGRENEQTFESLPAINSFAIPVNKAGVYSYNAPGQLSKPFYVYNEVASLEAQDNGTSVTPYAAASPDQFGVYIRGVKYDLEEVA